MKITQKTMGWICGVTLATLVGAGINHRIMNTDFERRALEKQVEKIADTDKDYRINNHEWKAVYDSVGKGNLFVEKYCNPATHYDYPVYPCAEHLSKEELRQYIANKQ